MRRLFRLLSIAATVSFFGFGALAILFGLVYLARKQGWTVETVGNVVLALAVLAFEWISSWPGYVWVALIVILLLMNVSSQLTALNYNVHVLTEAVRGLKEHPHDDDEEDDF